MKVAREAKGWNQTQLAEAVGLTQQAISKLERGGSATTAELYQMSIVLGVRYEYLKNGKQPMVSANPLADITPDQFLEVFVTFPPSVQADLFSAMARAISDRHRGQPGNEAIEGH